MNCCTGLAASTLMPTPSASPPERRSAQQSCLCSARKQYVRPGMIANGVIRLSARHAADGSNDRHHSRHWGLRECPAIEVWKLTGPLAFTRVIGRGGHSYIRIYPSFWFYPEHYSGVHYSGCR